GREVLALQAVAVAPQLAVLEAPVAGDAGAQPLQGVALGLCCLETVGHGRPSFGGGSTLSSYQRAPGFPREGLFAILPGTSAPYSEVRGPRSGVSGTLG